MASTTQSVTLAGGSAYLLSISVIGSHVDERHTYVVHAPAAGNLNVAYTNLISSSYAWTPQASVSLATEDGGGQWQANDNSNYTLKITITGGESTDTWTYSAIRML
jgi:hypothetical protein